MTTFYEDMADTAAELLSEFGQEVVVTAVTSGAYDPATGAATTTTTTQTAIAVEEVYRAFEIDGTVVKAGDRRLLVSPQNAAGAALATPAVGHTVTLGGAAWRIQAVEPYAPGGPVLYTVLQLRRD